MTGERREIGSALPCRDGREGSAVTGDDPRPGGGCDEGLCVVRLVAALIMPLWCAIGWSVMRCGVQFRLEKM